MQRYVAKEVIHRPALIQSSRTGDCGRDYFMYAQDYARQEWIPQLRVGKAHPFLGGEKKMFCWHRVNALFTGSLYPLGRGTLKIYRVRDADKCCEQPMMTQALSPVLKPGQQSRAGI